MPGKVEISIIKACQAQGDTPALSRQKKAISGSDSDSDDDAFTLPAESPKRIQFQWQRPGGLP